MIDYNMTEQEKIEAFEKMLVPIKELYKEISLLKDFVDLNIKAKGKILKKYRKEKYK